MKKTIIFLISIAISPLFFSPIQAQADLGIYGTTGGLQIIKTDTLGFIVKLDEQQIYETGAADLSIHKSYRDFDGDNVDILYEYSGGNICLAYSYLIIRWRPDGTYWVSQKFGNCKDPEIQQVGNKITLSFESYVDESETTFPAETWEYENDALKKVVPLPVETAVKKRAKKKIAKKKAKPTPSKTKKKVAKKKVKPTPSKTKKKVAKKKVKPTPSKKKKKVAKKKVKPTPIKKTPKKKVEKKIPTQVNELSYLATRDQTSKLVFVGGSACCNCVVDSVGTLPAGFPTADVHSVTFYLLASRSNSEFDKIQVGQTELKLILGDSQVNAVTQELDSETMDPVRHRWFVQFNFDPPVSIGSGTEWKLLDGDGTWKSAAIVHTSSKTSGGLPGKYITKGCQYARTEAAWYSVRFDFAAAEPVLSPLTVSPSASKTSGEIPLAVDFAESVAGGTAPYTYSWDFGDGTTALSQDPYHIYSTAGTYNVSLTVTDAQNNSASSSLTITVTTPQSPYYVYVDIHVFDPGARFLFKKANAREGWDTEGNLPSEFNLDIEACDAGGVPISGGRKSIAFESNTGGSTAKVIPTVTIGPLSEPPHHYRLALWENDNKDPTLNKGDHLIWNYSGEHCSFSNTQITIHGNSCYGVEECQGSGDLSFSFNDHYAFRHKDNNDFTIVNGVLANASPEYEKAYILVKVRK